MILSVCTVKLILSRCYQLSWLSQLRTRTKWIKYGQVDLDFPDVLLHLHDWNPQLLCLVPISSFKEYYSIICALLIIVNHWSPQQGIVSIGGFHMRNKCSTECIIFASEDKINLDHEQKSIFSDHGFCEQHTVSDGYCTRHLIVPDPI